ncbi:MAG TPA: response regulator transcription factor [Ktedonobacterales bacterium]
MTATNRAAPKAGSNGTAATANHMGTEQIRIMLIDEHPIFRQGCRAALEAEGDCVVIAESSESRAGLEIAKQMAPDVVLIDALLSTNDSLELARQLRHISPRMAIVMLTAFEDEEQLFQSMKLGAAAYLLKSIMPEDLVKAVRRVSKGIFMINDNVLSRPSVANRVLRAFREVTAEEPPEVQPLLSPLSNREIEILDYIAKGNSNKEIAKSLSISDQTVKNHITSILKKLSVNDRTAAVVHALKKGWIKMDPDEQAAPRHGTAAAAEVE